MDQRTIKAYSGKLRKRFDKLFLVPFRVLDGLDESYALFLRVLRPSLVSAWSDKKNAKTLQMIRELSAHEETSIQLSHDFKSCKESERLELAFKSALAAEHNLPEWVRQMEGMSGRKYRYLINNLISRTPDARYLEIGSWAGSTACSALVNNKVAACCIDNWSQFGGPKELFNKNIEKVLNQTIDFKFIEADFRTINYRDIGKYNVYFFDGPHSEEDQFDGVTIPQPALDNIFTLIVDDWNWESVRKGTIRAIDHLGIRVRAQIEIRTTQSGAAPEFLTKQYSDWHNGYFIAVCEKP